MPNKISNQAIIPAIFKSDASCRRNPHSAFMGGISAIDTLNIAVSDMKEKLSVHTDGLRQHCTLLIHGCISLSHYLSAWGFASSKTETALNICCPELKL